MVFTQIFDIPDSRQITLPSDAPTGRVQLEVKIIPFPQKEEKEEPPLKCLIGVDTSLVDSLVGTIPNPDNKTYKELRDEALMEKYKEYFE